MKKTNKREIFIVLATLGFATLLIYMFSHFGVVVLVLSDLLMMYGCALLSASCLAKAITSKDMLKGDRKTLLTIRGIAVLAFVFLLLSKTRFVIRFR